MAIMFTSSYVVRWQVLIVVMLCSSSLFVAVVCNNSRYNGLVGSFQNNSLLDELMYYLSLHHI